MFDWFDLEDKGCAACIGILALALILILGGFFLESLLVMWLWNAVVVVIMELPALSYWMACGIVMLCNLLFKPIVRTTSHKN